MRESRRIEGKESIFLAPSPGCRPEEGEIRKLEHGMERNGISQRRIDVTINIVNMLRAAAGVFVRRPSARSSFVGTILGVVMGCSYRIFVGGGRAAVIKAVINAEHQSPLG